MAVKLKGRKRPYNPKPTDEVKCHVHGVVTTWEKLTGIQQLAVENGIDTAADVPCLLLPESE